MTTSIEHASGSEAHHHGVLPSPICHRSVRYSGQSCTLSASPRRSSTALGPTTIDPGATSVTTVALAPTTASSPMVTGPRTIAPAPTTTRLPMVGLPFGVLPMVTCWLIQQSSPIRSASTPVANPCWMNRPSPICSATKNKFTLPGQNRRHISRAGNDRNLSR